MYWYTLGLRTPVGIPTQVRLEQATPSGEATGFVLLGLEKINIVPPFGDKSEAPAPLTTTNDPLKSLERAFKKGFCLLFLRGVVGLGCFFKQLA